ncbi:MAG: hypothetical protein OEV44_06515, partial [Spirochaetota bacterium]|nr:hypothetical protein [Spirochaetota bacterium]
VVALASKNYNINTKKSWQSTEYFGNYILEKSNFAFDTKVKVLGTSSGKFIHPKNTLLLKPTKASWFNQTGHTGSFTIEFWLRPATLSSGGVVFKKYGPVIESGKVIKYSGIICKIKNNRLIWQFHNIFHSINQLNEDKNSLIEITSNQRIKRNKWFHHALSFDANTGKLSYYLNGSEEKTIFLTVSGQPEDTILSPKFYPQEKSLFCIGEDYYGFIDEFIISRISKTSQKKIVHFAEQNKGKKHFNIGKYVSAEGKVISHVKDLGHTGSYLNRIKLNAVQKNGSSIMLQYRMSDYFFDSATPNNYQLITREDKKITLKWYTLNTQNPLSVPIKKIKGRYFQWRAILNGGENGKYTPILKNITFNFNIDRPPSPPKNLLVYCSEGKIYLKWKGNVENDVNRYKIYFGIETGNYLDPEGKSPIEITVNQLHDKLKPVYFIPNLRINEVYYFAITALDENGHESEFSNEVFVKVKLEK